MKRKIMLYLFFLYGLLTKKVNGSYVSAIITKTKNGLFAVDPEDMAVGRQLRMKGEYGFDEIDRLSPYLNSHSRALIVGAHIGTLAIPISRMCKEVVAIEANPNTYELLMQNIALNCVNNCQTINIAANNTAEKIKFLLSRTNSGGSKRVPKQKKYIYYYDDPEEIIVDSVSLDDCLEDKKFDVVVMDIERSEYFALQGMQEILSNTQLLAIEFLPHHLENVSGVNVLDFVSLLKPHFSKLTIPTKKIAVNSEDFASTLSEMYDKGQEDGAILFEKI
ncbi:MAG: FkbM family methyltransferase [Thermodesulfobacteriota bacterium]|nr:FkbM family methyltransferase [Thermodesulfobacteriota bacterium]